MDIILEFVKILELKRYSKQTINCYKGHLQLTKNHINKKTFKSLSDKELFEFIYHLVKTKAISASYQRQIVGALKLFYKEIHNRCYRNGWNEEVANPYADIKFVIRSLFSLHPFKTSNLFKVLSFSVL